MILPTGLQLRFAGLILLAATIAACGVGDPPQAKHPPSVAPAFELPTGTDLPGWTRVTDPEHYEAHNLWDYINGQADFFIDYGFVRVDTAEYRPNATSSSVVLEIYRMGRPVEAFGIFAAERTRDDRSLEIGGDAYLGTNVLGFWQGEHYVKLTSFDEGPEVRQSLIDLAEEIDSRIPGEEIELENLLLFPDEGRVEASERFFPKNFLGQPYLTDAFRVDYVDGEQRLQLFLIDTSSAEDAASHHERLEEFCRGRDRTTVSTEVNENLPMMIVDGPSKMVVFRIDHLLGGAIGVADLEVGRAAAEALARKVGSRP